MLAVGSLCYPGSKGGVDESTTTGLRLDQARSDRRMTG
jgi:hypothetical protein